MGTKIEIACHLNKPEKKPDPSLFDFATSEKVHSVADFHKSIPIYNPTPLVELRALAGHMGVGQLMVKDESTRFGLNAFKVLGASYAVAKALFSKLGLGNEKVDFKQTLDLAGQLGHLTFVTATDGNHGRAVAWTAKKLGCKARVFMPKGTSKVRLEAIQSLDAEVTVVPCNYDLAVAYAGKMAKQKKWILVQDTSWKGYENIPKHIMQGYCTLMTEIQSQKKKFKPTHVFVQAGVGSFAASILGFLCNTQPKNRPFFTVVEAKEAACIHKSVKAGEDRPLVVEGELKTIMAGLACGTPSLNGFNLLNNCANAFVTCSDEVARRGMRILGNPLGSDSRVISGESGAVTLGLIYEIMTNKRFKTIRQKLKLTPGSRILLFSTEGNTDPEHYRKVVWHS